MLKKKRGIRDAARSLQLMSHKLWRHVSVVVQWVVVAKGDERIKVANWHFMFKPRSPRSPQSLKPQTVARTDRRSPQPGAAGYVSRIKLRRLSIRTVFPNLLGTLSDAADSTRSCVEQSGLLHHLPSLSNLSLTCQMQAANCAMTDVR